MPGVKRGGRAFALLLLMSAGCSRGTTEPVVEPPATCTPQNTVQLNVGGALRLAGPEARTLCIAGQQGAEFVLVPAFATSDSGRTLRARFEAEATEPVTSGAPTSSPLGRSPTPESLHLGGAPLALEEGAHSSSFHDDLRRREARELSPRIVGGGSAGVGDRGIGGGVALIDGNPSGDVIVPAVGALLTLNAQPKEACSNALPRTGMVRAVSDWAIVVSDTASPALGFSTADFQAIATTVDTLLIPLVHRYFGTFTDLDNNGRVILFFTPEVNRLTEPGSDRSVGGFFFARDLFPRTSVPNRFEGCATSNVGEVLYLLVPDPQGTINGNRRTLDSVRRATPATIVHELQHLINAARRIHILQRSASSAFETVWLNEGLSHTAEELAFFQSAGLSRQSNLGLAEVQAGGSRALNAINQFHVPNLLRFRLYLEAPDSNSPTLPEDRLQTRGATQVFLRYAIDRAGGSDESFLRGLVDAPTIGWSNLSSRVGGSAVLERWIGDWAVAVFADDRVSPNHPDHRLASWSYPSLFAGLGIPSYPLLVRTLSARDPPLELTLVGGGSSHLRFSVPSGTARIVISSGTQPLPPEFRATLLRTR